MAAAAHKFMSVLDVPEFNRRCFNQVLPIDKIDCVRTDDTISKQDKAALAKTGVELMSV